MMGLVCFSNLFFDLSGEFQDISNKTLYVQPNLLSIGLIVSHMVSRVAISIR